MIYASIHCKYYSWVQKYHSYSDLIPSELDGCNKRYTQMFSKNQSLADCMTDIFTFSSKPADQFQYLKWKMYFWRNLTFVLVIDHAILRVLSHGINEVRVVLSLSFHTRIFNLSGDFTINGKGLQLWPMFDTHGHWAVRPTVTRTNPF